MAFTLRSDVFADGQMLSAQYTCDDRGVSPPLSWDDPPRGTQSYALIVDDPDAPRGDFIHWVLYDLPASVDQLPPAVPPVDRLDNGATQGTNGFGKLGYGAPCPPPGPPHRYRFTLFALGQAIELAPGATASQLMEAMQGKVLAQARLVGLYQRQGA